MTQTWRRRIVGVSVVGLLVTTADILVVPVLLDERPMCAQVAGWVADQNGQLPTTLDGLEAYPVSYRNEIFAALSPATRSQVFRAQLTRFRTSRELTSEQVAVVDMAAKLFSPEFYASNGEPSAAVRDQFGQLNTAIAAAFPDQADQGVFLRIGGKTATYRTYAAKVIGVREAIRGFFTAHADGYICDCTRDEDPPAAGNCPAEYSCKATTPACDIKPGCGSGAGWTCNGMCYKADEND